MRVSIRNLTKLFGETAALRDVSLEIQSQELFFLLGPSGCGKTTLLRLIAGFYQADGGEILFGDRPMNAMPPHQRNTGMVFQNYALWPHMTVADNVAYGLEVRGLPSDQRQQRVQEALTMVQLEPYADRTPNQLSGGQQQRVALARALVIKPDVLLLDEPLSNLDAKLRLEMREEIRRIHAQTRITTIYVTHDQKEALSLANRMSVLRDGRIEQTGTPREVYREPSSQFVADFIGETNWVKSRVESIGPQWLGLASDLGPLAAPVRLSAAPGANVWVGFRPEAVEIGHSTVNCFSTRIVGVSYLGETEQYRLELPSGLIIKAFEQNPREIRQLGDGIEVHVRPQNCLVLAG
jgi:iron(III) transport system ATP-binding protein